MVNNVQSDTSIVYFERKSRQTPGNTCKLHSNNVCTYIIWDKVKTVKYRWKSSSLSNDSLFQILVYGTEENCWFSYTKKFIFSHPENLLIAVATDERPHIRPLALRRVLILRSSQNETYTTPRIFKVPLLIFEAQDYTELINWSSNNRADPPIFRSFKSTQVEENIHTSDMLQLKSFPCHTQAVERGIRLVT